MFSPFVIQCSTHPSFGAQYPKTLTIPQDENK